MRLHPSRYHRQPDGCRRTSNLLDHGLRPCLCLDGLQRRLQALDLMRKLTADRPGQQDPEKAREFRMRLRLVT